MSIIDHPDLHQPFWQVQQHWLALVRRGCLRLPGMAIELSSHTDPTPNGRSMTVLNFLYGRAAVVPSMPPMPPRPPLRGSEEDTTAPEYVPERLRGWRGHCKYVMTRHLLSYGITVPVRVSSWLLPHVRGGGVTRRPDANSLRLGWDNSYTLSVAATTHPKGDPLHDSFSAHLLSPGLWSASITCSGAGAVNALELATPTYHANSSRVARAALFILNPPASLTEKIAVRSRVRDSIGLAAAPAGVVTPLMRDGLAILADDIRELALNPAPVAADHEWYTRAVARSTGGIFALSNLRMSLQLIRASDPLNLRNETLSQLDEIILSLQNGTLTWERFVPRRLQSGSLIQSVTRAVVAPDRVSGSTMAHVTSPEGRVGVGFRMDAESRRTATTGEFRLNVRVRFGQSTTAGVAWRVDPWASQPLGRLAYSIQWE